MSLDRKYQQSEHVVSRKIGDETILVPVSREVGDLENVYALNETAAYIWDQIDGKKDLKEIKECLVSEFDVDGEKAEKDLLRCIAQFEEMKGIQPIDK